MTIEIGQWRWIQEERRERGTLWHLSAGFLGGGGLITLCELTLHPEMQRELGDFVPSTVVRCERCTDQAASMLGLR